VFVPRSHLREHSHSPVQSGAMNRSQRLVFVLVPVLGALFAAPTHAASKLAKRPELLLTRPFKAEYRQAVDLDGDGDLDVAIVGVDGIVPTPQESLPNDPDGSRVLIVARKEPGGYRLIGTGTGALLCRRCGGAFWGVNPAPIELSAGKGTLIVKQMSGARETQEWRHVYRIEEGRVRLIGIDRASTDRASGGSWTTSENLLTGLRITSVTGDIAEAPKAGTVKGRPSTIRLEEIDLS
jgi:hypothetical protein